jgi:hypothetical protein
MEVMTMRKPIQVVPDRVIFGHPVYGKHVLQGRCGTSFNIASFVTLAASLARRNSLDAVAELQEQLRWIFAIVQYTELLSALAEYEHDKLTFALIQKAIEVTDRAPCISCQREDDPREHAPHCNDIRRSQSAPHKLTTQALTTMD